MEVVQGTHKAPEDFISNMPDIVINNILDRLPLQDAVRTAILARRWRYNWTMLSQLVFDGNFFKYLLEKEGEEKDYGRIISGLLLHTKGSITKFVLYIYKRCKLDDEDISRWLMLLSRKGVKDITLWKRNAQLLKLPTHFFSCLELKHLKLCWCYFEPPASFHGFPNLLSLELSYAIFRIGEFGKFFTQSPKLEILNLGITQPPDNVKLDEIAKLSNLKTLYLIMCDPIAKCAMITCSDSTFELVGSLPKLQELHLDFQDCKSFTKGGAGKRSSTAFPCLKALKLTSIDLSIGAMLSCAFELIRRSPKLQTLEITASECDYDPRPAFRSLEVDCNTTSLLRVRSAGFKDLKFSENLLRLIKYLLASSPFLKKIGVHHPLFVSSEEKLTFSRKLSKLHRASPTAEIELY